MKKTKKPLSLNTETICVLKDEHLKAAAGGVTNTCLGTACMCHPTLGPNCATNGGYTNCNCSLGNSNCGCNGTAYTCGYPCD